MKAILVFIDGTICDATGRMHLLNSDDFYGRDSLLRDRAVEGSVDCLNELAQRYQIVYIGGRPESTHIHTVEWLDQMGYPGGDLYLAENQEQRLSIVKEIKSKYEFLAGVGDRWDDNELHDEIGCLSIILKEHAGKWDSVAERIDRYHRKKKIEANRIHLQGKVEGLARVCPLLWSKFGDALWEAYFAAVMDMAEKTRETRRSEDLASFAQHGLNPMDLRDAAKWDAITREEGWENNPAYGLQEFELVEVSPTRYVHKVTSCYYADLWQEHGRPDIGYQIHCHTDIAWWDRPAWNPAVHFEQPQTLMQGYECCIFIQYLPWQGK